MKGVEVTTKTYFSGAGHIREHTIESDFDVDAYECGFSFPFENNSIDKNSHTAYVQNESSISGIKVIGNVAGTPQVILPDPNTNLLFPKTALPVVHYQIPKGKTCISSYIYALVDKGLLDI